MTRTRTALAGLIVASLTVVGPVLTDSGSGSADAAAQAAERRVKQRARLTMHPQIAHAGDRPASPAAARSAMTASFRPARRGRPVLLQRKKGRRWVNVAKTRQPRSGVVELTARYAVRGKPVTYRVLTTRYDGLPKASSRGVRTDVRGAADFTDPFSGTALGSSWASRPGDYTTGAKRSCSKSDPRAVAVKDGTLRLQVKDDPTPVTTELCQRQDGEEFAWRLNGDVGTAKRWSFRYGYAAARIKFQRRLGQHGAFWLMPEGTTSDGSEVPRTGSAGEAGAEIDVIEWFGERNRRTGEGNLASFVYTWPESRSQPVKFGGKIRNSHRYGTGWGRRYHVFSVEWTPRYYVFRIDGRQTLRIKEGVSDQRQHLILSLLSSDYELLTTHADPQTMHVDWARVWAR